MVRQNRRRQRLSQRPRTRISFRKIVFSSATFATVFIVLFIYSNLRKSEKAFAEGTLSLKNFNGRIDSGMIDLTWATSSETNADHFIVERSNDGVEYYEIGRVLGNGTSSLENEYHFADETPLKGNAFYRICQSGFDGTRVMFNPLQMTFSFQETGFQILYLGPNPFDDNLRVDYNSEETGVIEVSLLNSKGQIVRSEQMISSSGINSFIFGGLSSLSRGFYFIQLQEGNKKTQGLKVVKE